MLVWHVRLCDKIFLGVLLEVEETGQGDVEELLLVDVGVSQDSDVVIVHFV